MSAPASLTVRFTRPRCSPARAAAIALEHFELSGELSELSSERDRNFLIKTPSGDRFVLKLAHSDEAESTLDLQHRALERILERERGLDLPRLVRSKSGREVESVNAEDGTPHFVRMLTWVPGREWARTAPHSPELLGSLGRAVARIDRALQGFAHPAARRELKWDIARSDWIRGHLGRVTDSARRAMIERHLARFESEVKPALSGLRRGVIHNDANDWNVIVAPGHPDTREVAAIVDFGDMLESVVIADLAIACAYAMQDKPDPLAVAVAVVAGYHAEFPLGPEELAVLFPLIGIRLAVSVVNSAEQAASFPGDSYLTISENGAWATLERLEQVHPRFAHYSLRAAVGLEPCPASSVVTEWLRAHQGDLGPLLAAEDRYEALDLSSGSPLIETPLEPADLVGFSAKLFARIRSSGARVGIGRYDEARLLYAAEHYAGLGNERPIPRTVHLGLDLFVEPGTSVLAPLAGVVESVRDNGMDLDYGPTLVLRHEPESGPVFWTLYGHLGNEVLDRLRPGQRVARGAAIATVGDLDVNGGWPPHLHFQLITDRLDKDGEFPGVARSDQRPVWKSLSPDPNLIARLPAGLLANPHPSDLAIRAGRQAHLGPSLSISYRRPLSIVRGWKQFLYDSDGLCYLDAVNNVAHVGHGHPRVVRAIREQAALLNTNTRYLHERLGAFAERLVGLLPAPLSVCYFVNSGSEANELAIRLARVATGRRGMLVLDVGYHGNTTTLIDVSPYKHDGPGGAGPQAWVRKVALPDDYRGEFRRGDPDAGLKYAREVSTAIEELLERREPVAAFLAESLPSCGGQIVLPAGYLAEAYARVRAAGGVCIADEVQVGLGRVGTHCWGFETQRVVPDIVTMGKPIGNGHPLGAVVTTRAIASAFANGMEYFNTFGGNPVSCAAGLAVLQVLEEEGLQARALDVGSHLLEGLRQLVARHAIAGDARGLGLFQGLELVRDRTSREPAGAEAAYVANRMRERGILLSTDGPFHNVLKLKPPLCFAQSDAAHLVEQLDRVLAEDYLQPR